MWLANLQQQMLTRIGGCTFYAVSVSHCLAFFGGEHRWGGTEVTRLGTNNSTVVTSNPPIAEKYLMKIEIWPVNGLKQKLNHAKTLYWYLSTTCPEVSQLVVREGWTSALGFARCSCFLHLVWMVDSVCMSVRVCSWQISSKAGRSGGSGWCVSSMVMLEMVVGDKFNSHNPSFWVVKGSEIEEFYWKYISRHTSIYCCDEMTMSMGFASKR